MDGTGHEVTARDGAAAAERQAEHGIRAGHRSSVWQREPLTAGEVMNRDVVTADPHTNVRELAMLMQRERVGVVPIVDDDDRLLGVVTDRDIVVRGCQRGPAMDRLTAADLMTTDVQAVPRTASLHEVLELMSRRRVRRLPVTGAHHQLLGLVSLSDVAAHADQDQELRSTLERIAGRRSFWTQIWR